MITWNMWTKSINLLFEEVFSRLGVYAKCLCLATRILWRSKPRKAVAYPASASRYLAVREVLKPSEYSIVPKVAVVKSNPLWCWRFVNPIDLFGVCGFSLEVACSLFRGVACVANILRSRGSQIISEISIFVRLAHCLR